MEEITESEYRQEVKNYYKCVILDARCIYSNCEFCDIGIAFRKGIAWGKRFKNTD